MTRHLLNVLTMLSLALLVTVAVLWVRSRRVLDTFHVTRDDSGGLESTNGWWTRRRCSFYCGRGMLVVEWVRQSDSPATPLGGTHEQGVHYQRYRSRLTDRWPERAGPHAVDDRFGFYWAVSQPYAYGEREVVALPLALPAAAGAVLPSPFASRLFARRLRSKRGRCRACGYDLRATPSKCPECGTPASGIGT